MKQYNLYKILNNDFCPHLLDIETIRKNLPTGVKKNLDDNPIMGYIEFNKNFKKLKRGILDKDVLDMTNSWRKVIDYYIDKINNSDNKLTRKHYKGIIQSYSFDLMFNLNKYKCETSDTFYKLQSFHESVEFDVMDIDECIINDFLDIIDKSIFEHSVLIVNKLPKNFNEIIENEKNKLENYCKEASFLKSKNGYLTMRKTINNDVYEDFIVTFKENKLYYHKLPKNNVIEEGFSLFNKHRNLSLNINDDGDVTLSKSDYNFNKEFDRLNSQARLYQKNENIEQMKNILFRLNYMQVLLNNIIYNKDIDKKSDEYKEAVKIKSFVVKDFNKYLAFVLKHDEHFDLNKEYEQSRYSDENIAVNGSVISALKDLIIKIFLR